MDVLLVLSNRLVDHRADDGHQLPLHSPLSANLWANVPLCQTTSGEKWHACAEHNSLHLERAIVLTAEVFLLPIGLEITRHVRPLETRWRVFGGRT